MAGTGELKTKPTQHSGKELRSIGVQPDAIICRSDVPMTDAIKDKISLFCDVPSEAVFPLGTMPSVYQVPLILEEYGLGNLIVNSLELASNGRDIEGWATMVKAMTHPKDRLSIAVVGKYVELPDAYISVTESLNHAALYLSLIHI